MCNCAVALQTGGQRAEGRGQRAEGRGQRAEGRGQRAEGRGQRAKGKRQPAEDGVVKTSASSICLQLCSDTYAFVLQNTADAALKKNANNRQEEGCQERTEADPKQVTPRSVTTKEVQL